MLASVGIVRPAHAQEPNSAGLVIVHSDGGVTTRCVAFSEAQISGYTLLQRSGLDLNTEPSGMGETICRLDGEGCSFPQQSCFCQCTGESCTFWSYWQQAGGAWSFSALGASNSIVLPGSVDGWMWGPGGSNGGQAPPLLTHNAICATPAATATPSPTPSTTPTVPPTVLPTATASPTPTVPPTSIPLPSATPSPTWTAAPLPPTVAPTPPPVVPLAEAQSQPTADIAVAPWVSYFEADRRAIAAGESVTLRWRVHHADRIRIETGEKTLEVGPEGSVTLAPLQTVRYELVAESSGGAATVGLLIEVAPPTPGAPAVPAAAPPQPTTPITPTPVPSPVETTPTISPLPTPTVLVTAIPEPTAQAPGAVSTVTLVAPENALVTASPRMEATVTQVNADDSDQWALGGELWVVGMAALVGGLLLIFIVAAALWLAYWGE